MTVVAIMMVKDEGDILEYTLQHLAGQVDEVRVYDNGSSDALPHWNDGFGVKFYQDEDPAYYQSRKMSTWAQQAYRDGATWVIPCDADEYWYATDGRTIRDYLAGIPPDLQILQAKLYNHLPTALDNPDEPNPFLRLGWRQRQHAPLPKVAVRARPDLIIEAGNHSATTSGSALTQPGGLVVRHFSWRDADQYLRKIRNGEKAYAATDLPEGTGAHWRMWENIPDEAILEHFDRWFHVKHPDEDSSLMYDPIPSEWFPS